MICQECHIKKADYAQNPETNKTETPKWCRECYERLCFISMMFDSMPKPIKRRGGVKEEEVQ